MVCIRRNANAAMLTINLIINGFAYGNCNSSVDNGVDSKALTYDWEKQTMTERWYSGDTVFFFMGNNIFFFLLFIEPRVILGSKSFMGE